MATRRFLTFEWEAIAGIIAAIAAIVLHFLHIVDSEVLLVIAVVLIAVLFVRDIRRESTLERVETIVRNNRDEILALGAGLQRPDVLLVGPGRLRAVSEEFSRRAQGEMIWFHVCLSMFEPQALFDAMLRPAIENPRVRSVLFVLDESQKRAWEASVLPKLAELQGREKVAEPCWARVEETVSAILSDIAPGNERECLLSFWGEPFMSRSAGRDVPRYIFHVLGHSELVTRLEELERKYRLGSRG